MNDKKKKPELLMLHKQLLTFLEESVPKKYRKNKCELPTENTEDTKENTDEKE